MMKSFNLRLFIVVLLFIIASTVTAVLRLDMDTDIVRSLPANSVVVSDALDIFANHPIHDQIAVDVALSVDDMDTLLACGQYIEEEFSTSGLFREVGNGEIATLIPELALHVVENLPLLFTKAELEAEIAPRLKTDFIQTRLQESVQKLSSLEGIGQGQFIASDPLGFMEPVMVKMAMLAPLADAEMHNGFLLSPDRKHLLITARPNLSRTDTASARQLATLIQSVEDALNKQYTTVGVEVILTPVGTYRAALDNEQIIRHDVNFALLLSMLGIGFLLFIAFPRPLVGLLSLLPALFGTALSLLVFSLLHPSISIMVLGFGGAIISITVDHGIAYLLFLDRRQDTKGKEASHEVRSIGLLAVLTTCGAFLTLSFSGFPVFVQLGQFTAMGVLFSFLFVHFIFPYLTPAMKASSKRRLPLQSFVDGLYSTGHVGSFGAAVLASVLIFYANPEFQVNLESMNTVSQETMEADSLFTSVWGNVSNRVVLMLSAGSVAELQQQNDELLQEVDKDVAAETLENVFVASMLFPGEERAQENVSSWKEFWTPEKVKIFREQLQRSSSALGFSDQAFSSFLKLLASDYSPQAKILPSKFYPLLGINEIDGKLYEFINVSPGKNFDSDTFFSQYHSKGKIFDSPHFSVQLAAILYKSFSTMLAIIAVSIIGFLLIFYASWQLTLITLLPPVFSYVCTLGTMKLIGHPLDIPGLMLSIVILGMGIDYSIFFVRAHQRYRNPQNASFGLVRMAVFMAGTSTLIGFGVLCFAEHSLLRSIGITSLLGIGYSLLGAFLLLPPLLRGYFATTPDRKINEQNIEQRVRKRYQLMEAYPRMFARFKLKFDPMFEDLPGLLGKQKDAIHTILDIGCGYGVPGCWCLEYCKNAKLVGLDPDAERIRVATLAMGERAELLTNMASELPDLAEPADLVLVLDMLHYLDDASVTKLLANCFTGMAHDGLLLIRYVIYPKERAVSWSWKLEDRRTKSRGGMAHYRTTETMAIFLENAGFNVEKNMVTKTDAELVWLAGRANKK
jgi:uncharacterized protein